MSHDHRKTVLIEYPAHKLPIRFIPLPEASVRASEIAATEKSTINEIPGYVVESSNPTRANLLTNLITAQQQFVTLQTQAYLRYLALQTQIAQQYALALQAAPVEPAVVQAQHISPPQLDNISSTAAAELVTQPLFSRHDLEQLASGKISHQFGPLFEQQDQYHRQVRLPEPPLLLVDRVLKIEGEPGKLGLGSIRTETDVSENAWYLHAGRMPAGITVEAGQADLLLISWLGIDFHNQSKRVYRLLGCELIYYGSLPKPGDTLCFDIHVDGYAKQGDVRLFFFHYDGKINGETRLRVRNGQAGFFSDEELAHSQGVLWDATTADYKSEPRLDSPHLYCDRQTFSAAQLQAFVQGDVVACFGEAFYLTQTHTRTPTISGGNMLLLHEITTLDYQGGPAQRGYMRAVQYIKADDWFFAGHFKHDPCMPGTLMVEAGLQLAACYLTACGFTLNKDGWRFEPVTDENYHLRCRGQVIPSSKLVVYEIFVDELIAEPYPTVYVHLLGTVDGLKAFHSRMGIRLVPDWPLTTKKQELLAHYHEPKPVAQVDGFAFDYASLLACAWGDPADTFGELCRSLPKTRRVVRLPGPPYHFMSRILTINATLQQAHIGAATTVEYDVPPKAWYFIKSGQPLMPFCVLMEVALQPCGWLAVFTGNTLRSEKDLYFRNLDGTAYIHSLVTTNTTSLRTEVTLTQLSFLGETTIIGFTVACFDDCGIKVYSMDTIFGFFPAAAFADQPGLPTTAQQNALLTQPSDFMLDLTTQPALYCAGTIRLPAPPLLMLSRVTGYWHQPNPNVLCQLRAEKQVNAADWYFKAHFYQDPVQPGSLGVEALLQLLQFYMLHEQLQKGIANAIFVPMLEREIRWKYRGQVVPGNLRVTLLLDIVEQGTASDGSYAVANGALWVDGKCIYQVYNLALKIISKS